MLNEERKIISKVKMAEKVGVASTNTLICICRGKPYQDFSLSYQKLTEEQKDKLASQLSN